MKYKIHFLPFCALLITGACPLRSREAAPEIQPYFKKAVAPDTLRFEVDDPSEAVAQGDTIPNRLFFSTVDPALLHDIEHVADPEQAVVFGRQHFPWNDGLEAYWVDIRMAWFQHQSLLLYDKKLRRFTGRVTVAEWYGGDGGQILTGSWLLDYDNDGEKDLIRREIEHSSIPEGDEVRELLHESALRLVWRDGRFAEIPAEDNSLMVKRFPIRSFW